MAAPRSFNIETAAADFAGPGREIEVVCDDDHGTFRVRRMKVTAGPWTLSVIWGTGAYCKGARRGEDAFGRGLPEDYVESPDAEVAAWRGESGMIQIEDDTVQGWVCPKGVVEAIEAAEADDEDGIRAALIKGRRS
jgi:hypothetical protein